MNKEQKQIEKLRYGLYSTVINLVGFMLLVGVGILLYGLFGDQFSFFSKKSEPLASSEVYTPVQEDQEDVIENGIHVSSGLVVAEGFEVVKATCTACHSGKLVTQNRASREGWKAMIEWMQETQGLWELGTSEAKILDYLAANYAPKEVGRRVNLEVVEWYILED